MFLSKNKQVQGTRWIYERILEYCDDRANGIGGYYREPVYRLLFYQLFADAEFAGFCGHEARARYRWCCARRKRNPPSRDDWDVTGDSIRQFLTNGWLKGKNRTKRNCQMVDDLREWWDTWLFPSAYCRGQSKRRMRRRVLEEFNRWLNEKQLHSSPA